MKKLTLYHKLALWFARKALACDGWLKVEQGKWMRSRQESGRTISTTTWEADAIRRMFDRS